VSSGESGSPTLADVEAVVRENVSGHVDGDRHEQGKQRLLATLRHGKPRGGRYHQRLAIVAVAVAVLSGAGAYAWKHRAPAQLRYEVHGGLLSDSGYVRSNGPSGARMSFSDGTRVDLQDGARARIAAVDANGARLVIENGHAALNVTQRPKAAWYIDAGPFVIRVTGTQFDVDWSSYDDTLSVDLHEGTLMVSGPPAPSGVLLRAGQRLTAHEGRLSIEALVHSAQVAETPPGEAAPLLGLEAPLADPALALEPLPGEGPHMPALPSEDVPPVKR
jgi:ferric-dicitrate binding protein FerR (iron transport regulator)